MMILLITGKSGVCQKYTVDTIGINTHNSEYAPSFFEDGIVFCSDRKREVVKGVYDQNDQRMSDLYSYQNQEQAVLLSKKLTSFLHEGPATFSSNYDTIIFSRNQVIDHKLRMARDHENAVGLFISYKKDGEWQDPKPLSLNQENYNFSHPCLSKDGKYLFFASNIPNGFGGTDIYISKVVNGKFEEPLNAGKTINSKYNEYYPFFNEQDRLFFSSDRPHELKGFNVYFSDLDVELGWIEPSMMPEPVNSNFDDYAFISNQTGTRGYFSTNREKGNDNIYSFSMVFPVFDQCEEIHQPKLCYTFREHSQLPNDSLPLKFIWYFGDGTSQEGSVSKHCYADTGFYSIRLAMIDTISGKEFFEVANYELNIEQHDRPYISSLDTVYVGESILLSSFGTRLESYQIIDYFWSVGDSTKFKGREIEHVFNSVGEYYPILGVIAKNKKTGEIEKLCAYKEIIVVDKETYVQNTEITKSEIRENDEFKYAHLEKSEMETIHELGLDEDILFSIRLLKSDTAVTNIESYFPKLNDKIYHRRDDIDSSYIYELGYRGKPTDWFFVLQELADSGYIGEITGFKFKHLMTDNDFVSQLTDGELFDLFMKDVMQENIKKNITVYFDLNKWQLTSGSYARLSKKIEGIVLAEYFLIVEGYTDATGSTKHNDILAQQRALEVEKWFLSQGANENKIKVLSHGEKFAENLNLLNSNPIDSDRKVIITLIKKK